MMQLDFDTSQIDPRLTIGGKGDAFQSFVYEHKKTELPHLHPFRAAGKDGGIDHLTDAPGEGRVAIECKYCGTDGYEEVRKRWKITEANLAANLSPSHGPAQAQYKPWYRTDEPIKHYIFTTSARLENAARVDELRDDIRSFFHGLAAKYPHLAHLSKLVVEVNDWNYIEGRMQAFLRFRWFPGERPAGLRLLESEDESATGFRAWLRSSNLPFYSCAQHLANTPAPVGVDLPDETKLLSLLSNAYGTLGLVLVGRGGVGKTRLALEIGRTAAFNNWIVWVVHRRLKTDTLDQLAARIDQNTRILLIFDYIETHPEFTNIIQHLEDIVEETGHHIRYIATCRSSYYNAVNGVDRQRAVLLSMAKPATEVWLDSYRRATVKHILEHAGIPLNEQSIGACHDLPVLAAFLHWLHSLGRTDEMESLLTEADFGRWVLRRIEISFPGRNLDHSLARLFSLFPIPTLGHSAFTDDEKEVLYRLEQDGWIERASDLTTGVVSWHTAHDVLADQVALEWLRTIGPAANEWCRDLLREAIRFHSLPSALRSLQRLAEHLSITEVEWKEILVYEVQQHLAEWSEHKVSLLGTSLLSPSSRIRLLVGLDAFFAGMESDATFQSALGDLLRQLVDNQDKVELEDPERKALYVWIRQSFPYQRNFQYLRAWALRFAPEEFRLETLDFIRTCLEKPATQYLLCAWIYAPLPLEQIRPFVQRWCHSHSNKLTFSFIAEAWLCEEGCPSVIQPFFDRWFSYFLPTMQSSFVLTAWLKHASAPEAIQAYVTQWLSDCGTLPDARYVIEAWLEHAQAPDVVKDRMMDWLRTNLHSLTASFVFSAWIKHANAPDLILELMTQWLHEHTHSLTTRYVLVAWLEHANAPAVIQSLVSQWLVKHGTSLDAEFVLTAWLEYANLPRVVQDHVVQWLTEHGMLLQADFLLTAWLAHANAPEVVQTYVIPWLTEHGNMLEANFVLTAWLIHVKAPRIVQNNVTQWLAEHGKVPQARYLLGAWLGHAHAPDIVFGSVALWLTEHGKDVETQVLLTTWLIHVKEPEKVQGNVTQWLAEHGKCLEARFLLGAWLKHASSPDVVQPFVTQWLTEHGELLEAELLLSSWLEHAHTPKVVQHYVERWLSIYYKVFEEGSFVLKFWLRAGMCLNLITPFVIGWLSEHGSKPEAQFVLAAWLKARHSPEVIAKYVQEWLERHGMTMEASHILGPWLDMEGSYAEVRPFLGAWLLQYGTTFEAWHVIVASLRSVNRITEIRNAALLWCEVHCVHMQASFVLKAWLTYCREPGPISGFVERWLSARAPSDDTSHILFAWIASQGDPTIIEPYVNNYIVTSKNSKAVHALRRAWAKKRTH